MCDVAKSTETFFYYLGDNQLFDYEMQDGYYSRLIGYYVYANGERIASFKNDTQGYVRYYLTDHLGSVAATVDHTGIVKSHNLFRPWGEKLHSSVASGTENQFQYTGQYQDEELSYELAYYGQRYYDQNLKIFTSVDPMWAADPSFGSYVYARNNPVKYIDTRGEAAGLASKLLQYGGFAAVATGIGIATYSQNPDTYNGLGDAIVQSAMDLSPDLTVQTAVAGGMLGVLIAPQLILAEAASGKTEGEGDSEGEQETPPPGAPSEGGSKTKGLENQLGAHQQKLNDYMNDPDGHDNKGLLKNAGNDQALRQKIIDGRIKNLKRQIENFKQQIGKAKGARE